VYTKEEIAICYHIKEVFPQVARFSLPENNEQLVSRWWYV